MGLRWYHSAGEGMSVSRDGEIVDVVVREVFSNSRGRARLEVRLNGVVQKTLVIGDRDGMLDLNDSLAVGVSTWGRSHKGKIRLNYRVEDTYLLTPKKY